MTEQKKIAIFLCPILMIVSIAGLLGMNNGTAVKAATNTFTFGRLLSWGVLHLSLYLFLKEGFPLILKKLKGNAWESFFFYGLILIAFVSGGVSMLTGKYYPLLGASVHVGSNMWIELFWFTLSIIFGIYYVFFRGK